MKASSFIPPCSSWRILTRFTILLLGALWASSTALADWQQVGPAQTINGGDEGIVSADGNNPIAGAIQGFAVHPTDPNIVYVGAVNGGVWKTINAKAATANWKAVGDDLPTLSISAVAINPLDPNVVFAGSGRLSSLNNQGGKLFGVARSPDAGATWTVTGANIDGDVRSIVPMRANDAGGGQVVVVLSTSGVFRSTDGGASFTAVASAVLNGVALTDLIQDPANTSRLYAGGAGRVFKSENAGVDWAEISTGTGFVVTADARVLLAVANSGGANVVYAAVIPGGILSNVFRSTDQGANWTPLGVPTPTIHPGKQGSSHAALVGDPQNAMTVYISGDRQTDQTEDGSNGTAQFPNVLGANNYSAPVWRNVAGNWENLAANGANGTAPHADTRAMLFDSDGNLLQSNDGGIFKLVNPNGTSPADMSGDRKWTSLNGDIRELETHNAVFDPVSKVFSCGAQDNGINTQRATADPIFVQDTSGDGARVEIDGDQKAHPGQSIRYDSSQNFGNFNRRTYGADNKMVDQTTVGLMITAGEGQGQGLKAFDKVLFLQPFVLNQIDPKRMLVGTDFLYESMDRGDTLTNLGSVGAGAAAMTIKRESKLSDSHDNIWLNPDLRESSYHALQLSGDPDVPQSLQGVVGDDVNSGSAAMAYGGRLNGTDFPDVFYAGSGTQIFHRVTVGNPMTKLTTYPGALVRVLVMDPFNYKRIFVLDNTGKVFTSSDEGATWTELTANLGTLTADVRTLELSNPDASFAKASLYAGGLGGIWKMANPAAGATWASDSVGLPKQVLVYDLRCEPTSGVITAATLGRGIYAFSAPTSNSTPAPKLLNISTRMRVLEGEKALIGGFIITGSDQKKVLIRGLGPSLPVAGQLADPNLELLTGATSLAKNDNWKDTQQAEIAATTVPPPNELESAIVQTLAPAGYTAILRGNNGGTGVGLVEIFDLAASANSKLANISTRGFVDLGDFVMIGGVIIGGGPAGVNAKVLVRAIGPSLADAGVAGPLLDPTLELRDANAALVAQNDNWKDSQEAEITATTIPPTNEAESALVQTLPPGNYTAIVRGKNEATGVALVELYNLQ